MGYLICILGRTVRSFLLVILLFLGGVSDLVPRENICSSNYLKSQRNIRKIYLQYKFKGQKCLSWQAYLQLGKRAYLAGRLKEALWSANSGLQGLSGKRGISSVKLSLLRGSVLREMNRIEEAITILREIVFLDDSRDTRKMIAEQEKAHLQLIQAYYAKTESKMSQDVIYLITLFKNRYPKSKYLNLLQKWKQENRQ